MAREAMVTANVKLQFVGQDKDKYVGKSDLTFLTFRNPGFIINSFDVIYNMSLTLYKSFMNSDSQHGSDTEG